MPQSVTQQEKGEQENHVWSGSVTGARCCSCSTFLSSAEKTHSDPDNLRSCVPVPNVHDGLLCDSVCYDRMSELGHFAIEKSSCCFVETEKDFFFLKSTKLKVTMSHSNETFHSSLIIYLTFYKCWQFILFWLIPINCVGGNSDEEAPVSKV